MTDAADRPDGIDVSITRTGTVADLTDFLAWVDNSFTEEDYHLTLEFEATEAFDPDRLTALTAAAEAEEPDDETEPEAGDAEPAAESEAAPEPSLTPETWKYRAASTLSFLTRDGEPATSTDIYDALVGTAWEADTVSPLSQSLHALNTADHVDRVGKEGQSFLMTMTLAGEAAVAEAEEDAERTFEDLREEWIADYAATDEAGETAATGDDSESEAAGANEEASLPDRVTLNPGTWNFKIGSALYHADGPQTAADLEQDLAGTEWEKEKKHISNYLGELYREDVTTREKRERDNNWTSPYEYELTPDGEALVEDAARRAVETDAAVYTDVVPNEADSEIDTAEADTAETDEADGDGDEASEAFACPDCPKTYDTKGDLTSHRARDHPERYDPVEEAAEPAEPAGPTGLDALLEDDSEDEGGDLSAQFGEKHYEEEVR